MSNTSRTQESQIIEQKRLRTDNELREDPELWLSDGSVVLAARDDEGTTWGFKCHKSVLSKHSAVFEGMFLLEQPDDAEMHDGLPLVAVADRYADLKRLLQMLYDPLKYLPAKLEISYPCFQRRYQEIGGPLRLSHKYGFDALRDHLSKILQSHWPTSLEEWDEICERMRELWDKHKDALANPAHVITLSEEVGIRWTLGAAYYDLHTRMRNPKTFSIAWKETFEVSQVARYLASFRPDQHARFTQGSIYLRSVAVDILRKGLPRHFSSCKYHACNQDTKVWLFAWLTNQFIIHTLSEDLSFDPVHSFKIMKQSAETLQKSGGSPMCDDCQRDLPKAIQACRQYIWDHVPTFFGAEDLEEGLPYGYEFYLEDLSEYT